MRYSVSPAFAKAQRAHAIAYTTHDAFAAEGDDNSICAQAASEAEYDALGRMMTEPAQCAGDVLAKLKVFLDREMYDWNGPRDPHAGAKFREALERDLMLLQRPTVSTEMAAAFENWAAKWQAFHDAEYEQEGVNAGNIPLSVLHDQGVAWTQLMAVYCTTPGDFLAKAYVELLMDVGGWNKGYPFQVKNQFEPDDGEDGDAFLYDDLRNCDLGRCMMALGRVDFDARAWIDANIAVGGHFKLMVDPGDNNARTFWQGMDIDSERECDRERHRMLQELLGGMFHVERMKAVCDLIDQEYPEHRMSARQSEARAQGIVGGERAADQPGIPVPAGNGTAVSVEE